MGQGATCEDSATDSQYVSSTHTQTQHMSNVGCWHFQVPSSLSLKPALPTIFLGTKDQTLSLTEVKLGYMPSSLFDSN